MSEQYNHEHSDGLSINALLLLCFAIIALVPITILGIKIYNAAWDNALREVREKHQLLAENLAAPVNIYVTSHLTTLSLAAHQLTDLPPSQQLSAASLQHTLSEILQFTEGFSSILLIDQGSRVIHGVGDYDINQLVGKNFGAFDFTKKALLHNEPTISSIILNPFTHQPALFLATPLTIFDTTTGQYHNRALIAELMIAPLEKLRQGIRFGEQGHSAIVDDKGQVIAHPNPAWMKDSIKDLSHLPVVESMMAGKTGVTEFFSPFKNQAMLAGYAAVPELGWGVMVPQPRAEISAQVRNMLFAQLEWAAIGLLLALVTAYFLGRWITHPIHALSSAGSKLSQDGFRHNLPMVRSSAPKELRKLGSAFTAAIQGLALSRAHIADLNQSLQFRVDEATSELREANIRLNELARSDHLTQLANRRHFEQTLGNLTSLDHAGIGTICLLLVDIDDFKAINDRYGHAVGDTVLVQIAEILNRNTRQTDLAARYAGDEFVLLIHSKADAGRKRAAVMRAEIAAHDFRFEQVDIAVTVSIGLVTFNLFEHRDRLNDVLRKVDEAMYSAKRSGRNRVAELSVI